jgi:hypothetical protein
MAYYRLPRPDMLNSAGTSEFERVEVSRADKGRLSGRRKT